MSDWFERCPFCAATAFRIDREPAPGSPPFYFVLCRNCGARGPNVTTTTRDARLAWNMRTVAFSQPVCDRCRAPVILHEGRPEPSCSCDTGPA